MDKRKNVCYNYISNRCKAWGAIMISLEEIASRLVDRKDYDFSANKVSWEPKRAEAYVLPEFNMIESNAKGAPAKLRKSLVRCWRSLIA